MADQSSTNPTTCPAFTPTPSSAQFRATAVAGKANPPGGGGGGRQGWEGQQQPRAGEGVEGDVPQDEPPERRRGAPERRSTYREQGAGGRVRAECRERA